MPVYEYQCLDCHHVWSITERIQEHMHEHEVRCPKCRSDQVERLLGAFFAKTDRKT